MGKPTLKIINYCKLSANEIFSGGNSYFTHKESSFSEFAESAYRYLKIDYPKFHKMDNLSKLAFLTSEVLLKEIDTESFNKEKTGIYITNNNSSTDIDIKYFEQVKKGMASPALFVYTLPNIMIGEICIRNGFKGDHSLFISNNYDVNFQLTYIRDLFEKGIIENCIAGWVDLIGEDYQSFLFLCQKSNAENFPDLSFENINRHIIK